MTDHPTTAPMRQLLEAGFPAWQVANEANRHLAALRQISEDVEDRDEAILATEKFIAELPLNK